MNILNQLLGQTVIYVNEEMGQIWTWNGGCTVNMMDSTSGEAYDCFNFHDAPLHTEMAMREADRHADQLAEEEAVDVQDWSGRLEEEPSVQEIGLAALQGFNPLN